MQKEIIHFVNGRGGSGSFVLYVIQFLHPGIIQSFVQFIGTSELLNDLNLKKQQYV